MRDKPSFKDFIQWGFYGLISFGGYLTLGVIQDVTVSIQTLNKNVAVIIERTAWHRRDIDELGLRVERLETKTN